ncbi:protein snakeskin-like [Phlebotomus papatasi]|nr:protein snakeskin-like [Phlebotomus papatasi]
MCGNNWWKCHQSGSLTMSPTPIEDATSHNRLSVIKFMELSLAIASTVLHYYSFNDGELVTAFLATGTFCGYIIVLIAIFAGHMIGTPVNKRLSIFYSIIGSVMFITSGVFIIEAWEHSFRTRTRDLAITKGSVAIINGAVFLLDTIFTFRDK